MSDSTNKQRLFVAEYLKYLNTIREGVLGRVSIRAVSTLPKERVRRAL